MSNPHYSSASDLQDEALVSALNSLLARLHLTITLQTPYDLTPSLLLATLESIQQARLPIPQAIRESRDFPSKVQAMKIFLGVLENDILQTDVGLSEVDPRRLAAGEWDEVVFVGKLLCWLGQDPSILPEDGHARDGSGSPGTSVQQSLPSAPAMRPRTVSLSTHSTMTTSVHSNLSMTRSAPAESDTTVMSIASELPGTLPELGLFDVPPPPRSPEPVARSPPPARPRCIHEVEDLSLDFSLADSFAFDAELSSYCDCPTDAHETASSYLPPPRAAGWAPRDSSSAPPNTYAAGQPQHDRRSAAEASYAGLAFTPKRRPAGGGSGMLTRHTSPTQYTLALLTERAKLLAELAAITPAPRRG